MSERQTFVRLRRMTMVMDGVFLTVTSIIALSVAYTFVRLWGRAAVVGGNGVVHPLRPHPTCVECADGLLLPLDRAREESWPNIVRASLYCLGLVYSFFGVAIVADTFMTSIETITSATRRGADGKEEKVWNDTVANLTLMALGSSAPEILLSVIELVGNGFTAGDLGPSTIVGSAAFNLFVISAICVAAVPASEGKAFAAPRVFAITAVASVAAYAWLLIVLQISSPNVVTIWEGVATFVAFPVLVFAAYRADRSGAESTEGFTELREEGGDDEAMVAGALAPSAAGARRLRTAAQTTLARIALRPVQLAASGMHLDDDALEGLARHMRLLALDPNTMSTSKIAHELAVRSLDDIGKSRAMRRIESIRMLTGGSRPPRARVATGATLFAAAGRLVPAVRFSAALYAVHEKEGRVVLRIIRRMDTLDHADTVKVVSTDGTAKAGQDYEAVAETLRFAPGEAEKEVHVRVLEDAEMEGNETFQVTATRMATDAHGSRRSAVGALHARMHGPGPGRKGAGTRSSPGRTALSKGLRSSRSRPAAPNVHTATVVITDVDGAGTFRFEQSTYDVVESRTAELRVIRVDGCAGSVTVGYESQGGTPHAIAEAIHGDLHFAHGELSKTITVQPVNTLAVRGRRDTFSILLRPDIPGAAPARTTVAVVQDPGLPPFLEEVASLIPKRQKELRNLLDPTTAAAEGAPPVPLTVPGAVGAPAPPSFLQSWGAQVVTALTVHGEEALVDIAVPQAEDETRPGRPTGDEDEELGGGSAPSAQLARPSVGDQVAHLIAVPWKFLFAVLIPPATAAGGWPAFFAALTVIGVVTAVIGDLASTLGCCLSLSDEITAITLVALGTSLPDTFASRSAVSGEAQGRQVRSGGSRPLDAAHAGPRGQHSGQCGGQRDRLQRGECTPRPGPALGHGGHLLAGFCICGARGRAGFLRTGAPTTGVRRGKLCLASCRCHRLVPPRRCSRRRRPCASSSSPSERAGATPWVGPGDSPLPPSSSSSGWST